MHRNPLTIAIDGPSGSGKSSVSKSVARQLGLAYLDTGAMYRALAWWVLERGLDLQDHAVIAQAARDLPLQISTDPGEATVSVGGTDITTDIRTTRISTRVSAVASNLDVRAELARRQRALIEQARTEHGGMVAEGRDITTVVAPDAEHRILLTASEEARLARRAAELHGSAAAEALAATEDQIIRRDRDDAAVSAFFEPAEGVVGVDTSDLSFEQSVQAVLDVVRSDVSSPTPPLQRTLPTERDRET